MPVWSLRSLVAGMGEDELAEIAAQLIARVRDEPAEANGRWLAAVCPNPTDWWRLLFVIAAAVPVDQSWSNLTAWTRVFIGSRG